jgi:transcriptional regulator with XRE-family HTH domain
MANQDVLDQAIDHARLRRELPGPRRRRLIREAAGIPQGALASALGVARPTLSRWESGARAPRTKHLAAYVEALGRLAREAL